MAKRGRMYDPWEHAEQLGIRVMTRVLRTASGLWVPDARTIILNPRMRRVRERSVLAHELGHAHYEHRDDRPKHELQADRFAAERLIDPGELKEVAATSPDANVWCHELGVNDRILKRYISDHWAAA